MKIIFLLLLCIVNPIFGEDTESFVVIRYLDNTFQQREIPVLDGKYNRVNFMDSSIWILKQPITLDSGEEAYAGMMFITEAEIYADVESSKLVSYGFPYFGDDLDLENIEDSEGVYHMFITDLKDHWSEREILYTVPSDIVHSWFTDDPTEKWNHRQEGSIIKITGGKRNK